MSRIAAVAALVVLVAAGCGGGGRPQKVHLRGIPSALAQDWEGQAEEIAAAAAAKDDCRAQALAKSLRAQVRQKQRLLPLRLRSPLVASVDSLVSRTTCTPVTTETTPQSHGPKPPPHEHPPHKPKPPHKHHGHGGDQGGHQGGDG